MAKAYLDGAQRSTFERGDEFGTAAGDGRECSCASCQRAYATEDAGYTVDECMEMIASGEVG
jgi:hypothetical protein